MANLFDDDKNDNVRDDGRPRIVFSNLRRPSRPILAEGGYRAFSAVSTSSWFLVVFFIWIFQFEVTPSEALISQIAGSSVELSALAIALLAILLEVNRADRWFKLGLLVIATSLMAVVLGGFYLALTWQESFDKPQQITVVIVAILGVTAALQVEWKGLWRFLRLQGMNKVLPGFAHWLPRLRISIQFLLPIGLIWLPGLNRVTAVLVLFLGSILSLLALMLVTTLSVLRTKQTQAGDEEEEDPFMRTLRQRYENDIRVLIRVGEIKVAITNALKSLQEEERDAAQKRSPGFDLSGNVPNLVAWYDLKVRLRGSGLKDDDRYLERALDSLKSDAKVYGEGYRDGLWLVPTEEEILDCIPALLSLRLVYSTLCSDYAKKHGSCYEGLDATKLTRWLAKERKLPLAVAEEYILPRMMRTLQEGQRYDRYEKRDVGVLFVNRAWELGYDEWQRYYREATGKYTLAPNVTALTKEEAGILLMDLLGDIEHISEPYISMSGRFDTDDYNHIVFMLSCISTQVESRYSEHRP